MTTTPTIVVSATSTRAELEAAIAEQRARAQRLSRHDPRRDAIDETCDELVGWWMDAGA